MGTEGVAVTFCKVWRALAWHASSTAAAYGSVSLRAPNRLGFIKILFLIHSPNSGLLLLYVIHIHSISTLHPSVLCIP